MKKYVEVTMIDKYPPDKDNIEVGKKYKVVEERGGGVYIYAHEKEPRYFLYNDQFKEVEGEKVKYTEEDLKVGTKLRCTDNKGYSHWTTGKVYTVQEGTVNNYIETDSGNEIALYAMLHRLNKEGSDDAEFEIVKEGEKVRYTVADLKDGTKLRCLHDSNLSWWTKGCIYTVSNKSILDDWGKSAGREHILEGLNNEHSRIRYEIVEEPTAEVTVDFEQRLEEEKVKYIEKDIKEGMKLRCTDNNGYVRWTTGAVYEVKKNDEGVLYIEDVPKGQRSYIDGILARLNHNNDKSAIFEVVEEEPARLVRVIALQECTPDEELLKVGGTYKVMGGASTGSGITIYLDERPDGYYLHPYQYVFVDEPSNDGEKEVEELEELDAEAKILAKIEQLTAEAEQLFAKRDRVHEQAVSLNAKARRLEESLELLGEYM